MTKRTCIIDSCDKPYLARGWCSAHWTRWKRHGDPLGGDEPRSAQPAQCTVDGCNRKPVGHGECSYHRRVTRARQDPEWHGDLLAKRREWHTANPDKVAATRRKSRALHLDAALERARKWRAENRDRVLLNNWRRRRREHGLPENVVETIHPDVIFDRDGGICQLCLGPVDPDVQWPEPESPTVDHTIPACDIDSEHSYANTVLAHWGCNRDKSWVRSNGGHSLEGGA